MTKCCIVRCSASKNKYQPQLTFHRIPRKAALRKKWLQAIGEKNINPQHKNWFICSMHFEESCFNRTLNVVRLRDDALPTKLPFPVRVFKDSEKTSVVHEINKIATDVISTSSSAVLPPFPIPEKVQKKVTKYETIDTLKDKCLMQEKKIQHLNEKLKRKDKRIVSFKKVVKNLQQKNHMNKEQAVINENFVGAQDFLLTKFVKAKPLPNKYSKDIIILVV